MSASFSKRALCTPAGRDCASGPAEYAHLAERNYHPRWRRRELPRPATDHGLRRELGRPVVISTAKPQDSVVQRQILATLLSAAGCGDKSAFADLYGELR